MQSYTQTLTDLGPGSTEIMPIKRCLMKTYTTVVGLTGKEAGSRFEASSTCNKRDPDVETEGVSLG